ncbi:MAG TPA: phosphatase PAP2 family protein [Chloroflexia bacterium]
MQQQDDSNTKKLTRRLPAVLGIGLGANVATMFVLGKLTEGLLHSEVKKALDDPLKDAAQDMQNKALKPVMSLFSGLGEPWTLYPFTGFMALRWLKQDRQVDAATLGLALVGSAALNEILKKLLKRPRPEFRIHQKKASGSSFPSSHITMSLATYGTLAYLVNRRRKRDEEQDKEWDKEHQARRGPAWIWAPVLAVCALIGWSRIYLGVHHPTDVLGGAVAGAIMVTTCAAACNCLTPEQS